MFIYLLIDILIYLIANTIVEYTQVYMYGVLFCFAVFTLSDGLRELIKSREEFNKCRAYKKFAWGPTDPFEKHRIDILSSYVVENLWRSIFLAWFYPFTLLFGGVFSLIIMIDDKVYPKPIPTPTATTNAE